MVSYFYEYNDTLKFLHKNLKYIQYFIKKHDVTSFTLDIRRLTPSNSDYSLIKKKKNNTIRKFLNRTFTSDKF